MKMRGAWGNAVKYMGAAALICSALLLAVLGSSGNYSAHKATSFSAANTPKAGVATDSSRWKEIYGKLPLSFEENQGQTAKEVRYLSRGSGYELFLTSQEAVLALQPGQHLDFSPRHRFETLRALRDARLKAHAADRMTVVRLHMDGANPNAEITAADRLPSNVNYFIGNDSTKWHTDVPTFAKVKYAGIYPGVDLVFYGNQRRLEYDFVVAPGADPRAIRLKIDGAEKMRVDSRGDLVLQVAGGEVTLQKPVVYQQSSIGRREVAGSYAIDGNRRVSFSVPQYDRSEPLIVDPVLNYSTYIGGSGLNGDSAASIAVDSNGDAFIAGTSTSTDFPTSSNGFIQQPLNANTPPATAAFVAEIDPTGTTRLYASYIAGSAPGESAFGVAADPTGKAVYVTGLTMSPDFPTSNAANASFMGGFKTGSNPSDTAGTSFLVKFDPTQTGTNAGVNSFVYSTFIGGTNAAAPNGDVGQAVAVDSSGVAYVVGYTDASPSTTVTTLTTFPILNGFQTTLNNAGGNAFLAKIDTTKSGVNSLVYSTYLGGNGHNDLNNSLGAGLGDVAEGVAIDSTGKAYVAGATPSTDFNTLGTTNGEFLTYPAGNTTNVAFFSQIDTTKVAAASLLYLTYLGGTGPDIGFAIGLGPNNVAYLTGTTSSLNFPLSNGAYQTTFTGAGPAFVTAIDTSQPVASSVTHSTFLGGGGGDDGHGIKVDSQGNVYVAGSTPSTNFPVTEGPMQPSRATGAAGNGFISKLDPTLSTLLYSTYFGGPSSNSCSGVDSTDALAIDSANPPNAYITGSTCSATGTFPISANAFQPTLKGSGNAYIAKLSLIPTLVIAPSPFSFGTQPVGVTSAPQSFQITNNTSSGVTFTSVVVNGVSPANNTDFVKSADACSPSVTAGAPPCSVSVTFKPSAAGLESATLVVTATVTNGGVSNSEVFNISLSGTGSATAPGVGLAPTSLTFGNQQQGTTSAAKTVTLTNTGNAALTINTIAASGDFAATTGTTACPVSPATLAAGANCTINVTFTPTATGTRNGTLSVTDNAGGSPQTVSLTGTGTGTADFTLSAAPTSVTVAQGAVSSPVTITVNPTNGFNSAVSLTCTGAPAKSSCLLNPTSTTTTSSLTFTAHAMLVPLPVSRPAPPFNPLRILPLIVALIMVLLLRSTQRFRVRAAIISAILLCVTLAACSGSGSNNNNTQKGTYTLTITGTSGALSHTTTVSVTVD